MDKMLLNKAREIYEKVQNCSVEATLGLKKEDLLSPEKMIEYLDPNNKEYVRNEICGIGATEYIPSYRAQNRCLIRLSFDTYGRYGVAFSDTDYVESLTQMDISDAREWIL